MPLKNPKQKPKKQKYAANKKAFDEVLRYYRDSTDAGVGAMSYENSGSGGTPNKARPSSTDFRCDVEKVIGKKLKKGLLVQFITAYVIFDTEDDLEREMHAQKVLGDRRHSIEQKLGEEFRNRKIHPVKGNKGYFHVLRQKVNGI